MNDFHAAGRRLMRLTTGHLGGGRNRSAAFGCLLAAMAWLPSTDLHAQACSADAPSETRYVLASQTTVQANAVAVGAPASPWLTIPVPSGRSERIACPEPAGNMAYGVQVSAPARVGSYSEDGQTYSVFDTGIAGVGVILRLQDPADGRDVALRTGMEVIVRSGASSRNAAAALSARFIRIGDMPVGDYSAVPFVVGDLFARGASGTVQASMTFDPGRLHSSLGPACTVPASISVDLGNHLVSGFRGVGSVTSWVDFNLPLRGCPSGYSQLLYQVVPVHGVDIGAGSPMLAIRPGGATGVLVDLWDRYHDHAVNPSVPFAQQLIGLAPGTPDVDLGFSARLYQSQPTVTPGAVESAMEVRIEYR